MENGTIVLHLSLLSVGSNVIFPFRVCLKTKTRSRTSFVGNALRFSNGNESTIATKKKNHNFQQTIFMYACTLHHHNHHHWKIWQPFHIVSILRTYELLKTDGISISTNSVALLFCMTKYPTTHGFWFLPMADSTHRSS